MRKSIIITIVVITSLFSLKSQESLVQSLIREGIELHDSAHYEKAIEKFDAALKINPKSTLAFYELSLSYLELKDFDKALKFSTKVINSNEKNLLVGAYAVKGQALAESGEIETAIELLKEGLVKNGESYMMHFNLALNYYNINDIEKAHEHVTRAIELDKNYSGAFLLNAYVQQDKGMWIRSIFSFQMFLLLEPDSRRSQNAFSELLQVMHITTAEEKPVERSFVQMQLERENAADSISTPPLTANTVLNRTDIYDAIVSVLDSLDRRENTKDTFEVFVKINKAIITMLDHDLEEENLDDGFWSFYYPFFRSILNSNYYETYCRYISVSYYPESLKWWEENNDEAKSFINWFERGDDADNH